MAKVVLITGCSSGLGRALALRLHAEPRRGSGSSDSDSSSSSGRVFTVYASARNLSSLKELQAEGIRTVQLDVTNQKSVDAAVKKVVQEAGTIDVLINNAGLSRVGPIVEQPLSEVEEVMAANFFGVIRVTQAVVPHMMRQRSGLVLMTGSVVSMLASPFGAAYSASKAALLAFSDSLRLELQPFGVHVSYVVAGAIRSSISDNILAGSNIARYERPTSLYAPLAGMIRARAEMSQDPKTVMSAEATADEIAAVVVASMLPPLPASGYTLTGLGEWCSAALLRRGSSSGPSGSGRVQQAASGEQQQLRGQQAVWRPRPPPNWFLAGGNARQYWLVGVAQKLLPQGWPANSIMAKKFGLHKQLE